MAPDFDEDFGNYARSMAYEKDGTRYDEEVEILYLYNLLNDAHPKHVSKGREYLVLSKELLKLLGCLYNITNSSLVSQTNSKILVSEADLPLVLDKARQFMGRPDWEFTIEKTIEWQDNIDISDKLNKYEYTVTKHEDLPW